MNVPMCCFLNTEIFLKSRTALLQDNEKTFYLELVVLNS